MAETKTNLRQANAKAYVTGILSEKNLEVKTENGAKSIQGTLTIKTSDVNFIRFGVNVNEITKDVWKIEKLDIQVKQDLIRPRKTISFTGISQPELKEEIKKAVYFQLRIESLETVKKELTAIRRFSRYLNEHKKNIQSCADLDRTIIEEYLVYMKTEDTGTKKYRAEITRLRSLLNMVADIYQYPQVKDLILNRTSHPISDQNLKSTQMQN